MTSILHSGSYPSISDDSSEAVLINPASSPLLQHRKNVIFGWRYSWLVCCLSQLAGDPTSWRRIWEQDHSISRSKRTLSPANPLPNVFRCSPRCRCNPSATRQYPGSHSPSGLQPTVTQHAIFWAPCLESEVSLNLCHLIINILPSVCFRKIQVSYCATLARCRWSCGSRMRGFVPYLMALTLSITKTVFSTVNT